MAVEGLAPDGALTRVSTRSPRITEDVVGGENKAILADTYASINPAAVKRQIQALTSELLANTTSKAAPKAKASATRISK